MDCSTCASGIAQRFCYLKACTEPPLLHRLYCAARPVQPSSGLPAPPSLTSQIGSCTLSSSPAVHPPQTATLGYIHGALPQDSTTLGNSSALAGRVAASPATAAKAASTAPLLETEAAQPDTLADCPEQGGQAKPSATPQHSLPPSTSLPQLTAVHLSLPAAHATPHLPAPITSHKHCSRPCSSPPAHPDLPGCLGWPPPALQLPVQPHSPLPGLW